MSKQIKIKETVNIENLYAHVTCPLCEKSFRLNAKNIGKYRLCACAKIGFKVVVENLPGYLRVSVEGLDGWNRAYIIEPDRLEIDET